MRAIVSASDNLDKLAHLEPVMDNYGEPLRSSGAFAIVFKMRDPKTNKFYALKCFTVEQPGRAEAYKLISEELESVDEPYITSIQYLEDELFVDSSCDDEIFPVLLMDWVEGVTMDVYIKTHIHDTQALNMLCYRFGKMANWLRNQSFAHGDIKPDNILVREDGTLTLVDYDGMFVPAMKGQKSPTIGTRDFVHPERTPSDFDENIDDFTLASIALSLKAIALKPSLFNNDSKSEGLLFTEQDYKDLPNSKVLEQIKELLWEKEIATLYGMFFIAYAQKDLSSVSFRLFNIAKPKIILEEISAEEPTDDELAEAWEDEYGVKYSKDGKRLLKARIFSWNYIVRNGTKVICDRAFCCCDLLKSIHLPDSLTTIGDEAFKNCESLIEITLSSSLQNIQGNPFVGLRLHIINQSPHFFVEDNVLYTADKKKLIAYLSSTNSFNVPQGVTTIGVSAFKNCDSLTSIRLPNSVTTIGDDAFLGCDSLTSIRLPDSLTTIGAFVFSSCKSLKSIYLPDSLTMIGDEAFKNCESLTEITLSSSLQNIQVNPFVGLRLHIINQSSHFFVEDNVLYTADKKKLIACLSSKNNFTVPQGVTTIGDSAFEDCKFLTEIHLPESLTTIGDEAFLGCESLTEIHLPESLTTILGSAFEGCNLKSIHLPESLTTIGDGAFFGCESLIEIHLPESLTTIEDSAFGGCQSLKSIHLPDSLIKIGNRAFCECCSLRSIHLPDSLTTIGDGAFFGCESLIEIYLPESLTTIGDGAFFGCESLTEIHLPDSLITIRDSAFEDCKSLTEITLPSSLQKIQGNPFVGLRLHIINQSPHFFVEDNVLYTADKKKLIACLSSKNNFTVPQGVTTIGDSAFEDCKSLTEIHLPESLTTTGDRAFSGCSSLESIHLPDSLTTIGYGAFLWCSSLFSIHLPESLTTIGEKVFSGCSSLESIHLPESLTTIGEEAFYDCKSLKSIYLPDSLTTIGTLSFYNCKLLTREIKEKLRKIKTFLLFIDEDLCF